MGSPEVKKDRCSRLIQVLRQGIIVALAFPLAVGILLSLLSGVAHSQAPSNRIGINPEYAFPTKETPAGVEVNSAALVENANLWNGRMISPESARVVQKWHHITTRVLDDSTVRTAMLIVLSYVGIYGLGALVGVYYGYDLVQSLFESVSAGSNSGLSCGVTSPIMPTLMKIIYTFEMWAGRLEFMSLFALTGYIVALMRGR